MLKVNLHEAKARLGEYVGRANRGETIIVCQRNRPMAELRGISSDRAKPLKIGVLKGQFEVPEDFDEPLLDFESEYYSESTS